MAYSYIVNKARGGTATKQGDPLILTAGGVRTLIYEVEETEVGTADEFVLTGVPAAGQVSLYESEITDDNSGTVTTLQPVIGTAAGFTVDTLNHIDSAEDALASIREPNWALYSSPTGKFAARNTPDASGGNVETRISITEGHSVPAATVATTATASTVASKVNAISVVNSRAAATLAAAGTFQGVGEDVSAYGRVGVAISSTNATDGTLTMEVSHDNVTWGGPTRTWADTRFGQPHMWQIVEKYFRIKYVNGSTEATALAIQTHYSVNADVVLGHQLNETLTDEVESQIVRAVLVGEDDDGTYRNVKTTRGGGIDVSVTDADLGFHQIVTPGGSAKVASQTHLVGGAFGGAALNTIKYDVTLTGTGTQDATGAGTLALATGTTANSAVAIQTADIARFIPANYNTTHHAVRIPDGASYATTNSRKWGAFNAASGTRNGCYFELDSGTWYVAHCINGTTTRVTRASWTGAAALQFPDAAVNTNVYEIEYNAGSIIYRCNGGVMHRVNLTATPWTNSVNLRMGIENINSGGSTTDVVMNLRAGAIYTLGKGQGLPRPYYVSGTNTGVIVKTGSGHLGKIIFARNGAGGGDATLSIYDGLSAVNQIGRIALDQDTTIAIDYDLSFNTGLYIVITGAGTLGTTVTFD